MAAETLPNSTAHVTSVWGVIWRIRMPADRWHLDVGMACHWTGLRVYETELCTGLDRADVTYALSFGIQNPNA